MKKAIFISLIITSLFLNWCGKNITETEFLDWAKMGNLEVIKEYIEKKWDINTQINGFWDTALIISAKKWYEEIVKFLLKNKADINIENRWWNTALIESIENWNINIIKQLLNWWSDINKENNFWETALKKAAEKWDQEIVKLLIENWADVNIQWEPSEIGGEINDLSICTWFGSSRWWKTALMSALWAWNIKIAKILIENWADVNIKDYEWENALFYVGDEYSALLLIENWIDINTQNNCGNTVLFENENIEMIKFFIKKWVNVNTKNKYGLTVTQYTKQRLDRQIIKNEEEKQYNEKTFWELAKNMWPLIPIDKFEEKIKILKKFWGK